MTQPPHRKPKTKQQLERGLADVKAFQEEYKSLMIEKAKADERARIIALIAGIKDTVGNSDATVDQILNLIKP